MIQVCKCKVRKSPTKRFDVIFLIIDGQMYGTGPFCGAICNRQKLVEVTGEEERKLRLEYTGVEK